MVFLGLRVWLKILFGTPVLGWVKTGGGCGRGFSANVLKIEVGGGFGVSLCQLVLLTVDGGRVYDCCVVESMDWSCYGGCC